MDAVFQKICRAFGLKGTYLRSQELKNGNINRTFQVTLGDANGAEKSYILQRVNTYVFQRPVEVMENIDRVTSHIRQKDGQAVSLHFHHTANRANYLFDEDGSFWRLFNYVPSVTFNTCDDLTVVRGAGEAFGEFQQKLADFDASTLHETIAGFHDTAARYEQLMADVQADRCGKVSEVRAELDWLGSVREKACLLTTMLHEGKLPLRVTHNDTKINNVLFDAVDHHPLVVIDLDTVMPGLVGHDFGDAIRFVANTVEEDSPDADAAKVRLDVFEAFAQGFLSKMSGSLTKAELDTLALSCFVMTTELAVRFLNDYINGSPYFKTLYPEHNLVRTRCQIALAKDMLLHLEDMQQIVARCAEGTN